MADYLVKVAYLVARDGPSSTVPTPPTSTSLAPSAASTSAAAQAGQSGPQSSPLLFFVALGFGVVFTNLWIIVGVKYCFRYNARNRAMRQDENGEPIDLAAMPRAHRRRREKKLMTMDEVNERFPLTKYKAWIQARAEQGLSTAGGVANPSSRPASVKGEAGVIKPFKDIASEETDEATQAATSSEETKKEIQVEDSKAKAVAKEEDLHKHDHDRHDHTHQHDTKPLDNLALEQTRTSADAEEDDEDDQIQIAVPTELLENPGDSCAICLDTLDDEDDVRGLTCGHAFHASCIDPWLTSRRACCPLCKADYYTPKPRPEGEAPTDASVGGRGPRPRADGPNPPPFAFMGGRRQPFGPRMVLPGRLMSIQYAEGRDRYGFPTVHRVTRSGTRPSRFGIVQGPMTPMDANTNGPTQRRSRWARFRPNFTLPLPTVPSVNGWRNRRNPTDGTSPEIGTSNRDPTPGQLESGTA